MTTRSELYASLALTDRIGLMEEEFTHAVATYTEAKFPSDGKRGTSGVIHAAYAEKIKKCLKNPNKFPKHYNIL